jgi:outer membrane protein OmpA-like peptidoglycan-associated protein
VRRLSAILASGAAVLASLLASSGATAEEGRFDAQVFRPSAAPRDLVMVQKSEVIGNLSPTFGLFTNIALDPLVLVNKNTNQRLSAVAARLELTGMAGIGFFNWFDISLAVPFVAWQSSDNLRPIGTEGPIKSSAMGDLRFSSKVAIPYFNRKSEVKSGFGMAVVGNVNLPTGSTEAFTSDGVVTYGGSLIADYRFSAGLLVAANGGVWIRPDRQLAGVRIGDMASFGLSAEAYVVQRWGISVIGEVYGYPSLTKYPDSIRQIPAEFLLGARWQTKQGVTVTIGGSFGAACGFGAPAVRFFSSITWQPKTSREQDEINRLQEVDSDDPDHDGLIGAADHCPNVPGAPENLGCPDKDSDEDGVIDREDECPDLPGGPRGKRGCPTAYLKGDEIVILDEVHFATDKDILLDESKPILLDVVEVLLAHPELREVRIEGHTDVRATDAYNMNLSQRRVNSAMAFIAASGIDPTRLQAKGYGHTQPVYDDTGCLGPDEGLSPDCKRMTSKNRRVVFRILRRGAPPPRPISGTADGNASSLPSRDAVLPGNTTVLPTQSNLPSKGNGVLDNKGVLPSAPDHAAPEQHVLPTQKGTLPSGAVLPKSGATKKDPPKKVDPPKDDPKTIKKGTPNLF